MAYTQYQKNLMSTYLIMDLEVGAGDIVARGMELEDQNTIATERMRSQSYREEVQRMYRLSVCEHGKIEMNCDECTEIDNNNAEQEYFERDNTNDPTK